MVRHAKVGDISRIAEILVFGKRVAYRPIFQDDVGSFLKLQVGDIIRELEDNPCLLAHILLYDDGIVKGVINYKDYPGNGRNDEIEICDFYVEPFFKRQGIGQKLIKYACYEAKRKQKKKIYLQVIESNETARKFYELSGFTNNYRKLPIEDTKVMTVGYEKEI
ncbi:MAG: GNAT family N-acetyltransferase [Lachnospiraceae bacterium]|nr:GNAT family N-acetyltransferase [Lachnospiraceae bacterium]